MLRAVFLPPLTALQHADAGVHALAAGALLSTAAALAHLACIALGAPAYRFMGAGERMARAAEARRVRPMLVTLAIAGMLLVWAAYALSGAGLIPQLPLTRPALVAICGIYLGRAVAFPWLRPVFPENARAFWWISSAICLVVGLTHLVGVWQRWPAL